MSFLKGLLHKPDGSATGFAKILGGVLGVAGTASSFIPGVGKAAQAGIGAAGSAIGGSISSDMTPSGMPTGSIGDPNIRATNAGSSGGILGTIGGMVNNLTHPSVSVDKKQLTGVELILGGLGVLLLIGLFRRR